MQAAFEAETVTLDQLLEAQRRRAEAQTSFFRTLLDYQRAIITVHYRKGSLLEYNNVYLTEGPWPAKASFDAHRLARQRDASVYLNYGFTRPAVMSQGPVNQGVDGEGGAAEGADYLPMDGVPHKATNPEVLPAPTQDTLPEPAAEPTITSTVLPMVERTAHQTSVPAKQSAVAAATTASTTATPNASGGFEWGSLGLDENASAADAGRKASGNSLPNRGAATAKPPGGAGRRSASRVAPRANDTQDGSVQPAKVQQWKSALKHESVENQSSGPTLGAAASGQGS